MSSYRRLSPESQDYLVSNEVFNNLTYNTKSVTLSTNISASTTPIINLDGNGWAFLQGQVTINTSSVETTMPLCSLPVTLTPQTDTFHPVVVLRAGALVTNAVKVESGGNSISSVTISTAGVYAAVPTLGTSGNGNGAVFTANVKAVTAAIATAQSSTGSYAPGDNLTGTGGTSTQQFVVPITHTKLVSATVTAGGTGGTNGTQTVTGTTGTGTKFQASVTVSGNAITAILSITVAGDYTVNPTSLTAEPVTGAALTGATLNLKMGALTLGAITTAGAYTAIASNPITTTSSGSGTGCTLNVQYGLLPPTVVNGGTGFDSASAFVITGGSVVTPGAGALVLGGTTNGLISLLTQPNQNDVVYLDGVSFLVNSYR